MHHFIRSTGSVIGLSVLLCISPAGAQDKSQTDPASAKPPAPVTPLKALGQEHQAKLQALQQAFEQQVLALLTAAQAALYGTDEPILLTQEQMQQLKTLQAKLKAQKKAEEKAYNQQASTLITPEEIARNESAAQTKKLEALSKLPLEEQKINALNRQKEEQMAQLRAARDQQLQALLTPEQARQLEEEGTYSLDPDQIPAYKEIEGRFKAGRQALEQTYEPQIQALIAALPAEQAAKYHYQKPPSKGGFITAPETPVENVKAVPQK
jgi:hypothetical protein